MKALIFERSLGRYAAARISSAFAAGSGAKFGPLHLADVDEPALPGPDWHKIKPRLSGICGSDLSTVDGRSSRYFEAIVSFPFTPGHEVVGDADDGRRVVLEPVLTCATRGITPPCGPCTSGRTGNCENVSFGRIQPGLQTGFCCDTGGGWSKGLVAHKSQLHGVPSDMSDEAAVMVEPTACAIHGALIAKEFIEAQGKGGRYAVIGAGTLGLCVTAALKLFAPMDSLVVAAKHAEQQRLAAQLGASQVVAPGELRRATRRNTESLLVGDRLSGGVDVVIDCVGNSDSIRDAMAIVRPRGRVVMVGMPGTVSIDLTGLWHRETELVGAYAYGLENNGRRTFDMAFDLVREAQLERLVSALYPLERYHDAIDHAANAGRRGAIKVAFDMRTQRMRQDSHRAETTTSS